MSPQPKSPGKPLRVLGGMLLMIGAVAIALAILSRFAGNWGVPYFSFTTDRGSTCHNTWSGYVCDDMTVADVNYYADTTLPAQARVVSSNYVATHDYVLDASLEVPAAQQAAALAALKRSFGDCVDDQPSPLKAANLKQLCVMADDLSDAGDDDPAKSSRLYSVGTAVRSDGSRAVVLSVRSR